MTGIAEIGATILQASQRRLELISQNISNVNTPGFQALQAMQSIIDGDSTGVDEVFGIKGPEDIITSLRSQLIGDLQPTDNPFDFALASEGYFAVRDPATDGIDYTRNGQFSRSDEGFLLNRDGHILQSADGYDLKLSGEKTSLAEDGRVFEGGLPVDRVGIFYIGDRAGDESQARPVAISDIRLRQGMFETSNTSTAGEMVEMMVAIRQAEIGAQILQSYDTLMGQAISTFGRS